MLFKSASISDNTLDDTWIGLRKASNDNYYWSLSGNQLEHKGSNIFWESGEPSGPDDCVFMDLGVSKHVKNSFDDYPCNKSDTSNDVSFCQIPYV